MPSFSEHGACRAPVRQVWKLLHDPTRIAEWFGDEGDRVVPGDDRITVHTPTEPHPLPHAVDPLKREAQVRFSCLTSGITFDWRLRPEATGCSMSVLVEIPDSWAHYLEPERALVRSQIVRLGAAAESAG